ncbi:hypothetical protein Axi01nite_47530 [Actinoplanes xinjiangensis]|nr:hypothetical protein Axi01nite_47530 [Actinoplanes xinjiangensis]
MVDDVQRRNAGAFLQQRDVGLIDHAYGKIALRHSTLDAQTPQTAPELGLHNLRGHVDYLQFQSLI